MSGVRYGSIVGTDDISLTLEPGQTVALVGSNGAGKSSTLKAVMGLAAYPTGDILLDGRSLKEIRTSDIVRSGIGYSPEGRRVFTAMTVLENLKVGAFSRPGDEFAADVERVFGYFPRLKERASQRAGSLSGGEQQMLAIGRALMSRPSIFLLDEPSLGLAPVIVERIGDVLKEIQRAEQLSVLLSEQNAAWALSIADEAVIVELGRITMTGAAREIAQRSARAEGLSRDLARTAHGFGRTSSGKRHAVLRDLARRRDPEFVAMTHDVIHRAAERAQAERLPDDERMQRHAEHERAALREMQHLVELIDDHLLELAPRVLAEDLRRRVVDLERVGHGQDRPRARAIQNGWSSAGQSITYEYPASLSRSSVVADCARYGPSQPSGLRPVVRISDCVHSLISAASSASHRTSCRSAFERPCPTHSSPRALMRSTISGHSSSTIELTLCEPGTPYSSSKSR